MYNGGSAIDFFLHKCLTGGVVVESESSRYFNNYNAHPNQVDWTGVRVWD